MANNNDVVVNILLGGSERFKRDTAEALGSFSKSASSKMNEVGKVAAVASKGILAAGAAIVAAGGFAIKQASNFEQISISFEAMLNSGEAARDLLNDLSDFAMRTPFELPELEQVSKQLLAYGFAAKEIIPTLTTMGNISAGLGKESLPILIRALGQIRAKGKLMGQELLQLTETGLPIVSVLARKAGVSVEEFSSNVANLNISFGDVQKAIEEIEKSNFNDLMAKQSKTLAGTWSNIGDSIKKAARELAVSSGLYDTVKKASEGIMNALAGAKNTQFFEYLKKQFELAQVFFQSFGEGFMIIWDTMQFAVQDFMNTLSTTFGVSMDNSDKFKANMQALGRAVGIIVGGIVVSILSISGAILKVNNAIAWIIGKIQSARTSITGAFTSIANGIIKAYNAIPLLPDIGLVNAPKFANGGIVGGNSTSGDKVIARVNSGEMILNGGQQSALFKLLQGLASRPNVSFNAPISFGGQRSSNQEKDVFSKFLMNV